MRWRSSHRVKLESQSSVTRVAPKISKSLIGLQNTEPGSGEVFLDIYNLSSGEKVAAARAPYGKPDGFAPSMLFSSSVWIEDKYIIMPCTGN